MQYITLKTLCDDIRANFWKVPKDVMGVVGVPRSGMIPATILSEYLNVGLTTVENLISNGVENAFINGERPIRTVNAKKVLVVDDTCFGGTQIQKIKKVIESKFKNSDYEFIFLVVYLEGRCQIGQPDIYLRDVRDLANKSEVGIVLYEWNILGHTRILNKTLFDFDGVFCVDPPDERNVEMYVDYIKNPIPLFFPLTDAGRPINILTYRLKKYREITENSLRDLGFANFNLHMFDSDSYEERSKTPPSKYKGQYYQQSNFILFVESDDRQAQQIFEISGKPVYCVGSNILYSR